MLEIRKTDGRAAWLGATFCPAGQLLEDFSSEAFGLLPDLDFIPLDEIELQSVSVIIHAPNWLFRVIERLGGHPFSAAVNRVQLMQQRGIFNRAFLDHVLEALSDIGRIGI